MPIKRKKEIIPNDSLRHHAFILLQVEQMTRTVQQQYSESICIIGAALVVAVALALISCQSTCVGRSSLRSNLFERGARLPL